MKEKKNDDTIKESAKKAEEAENTQEDTKEASQETSAAEEYVQPEETEEPEEASKEEEYLQLAQRIQADFDNYRKRNASLRADAMADGKAEAVKSFLPVMDNLERALQTERENGTAGTLMEGLEMVLKQMAQALKELGVEEIEAQGLPFDPACHNAVMQVPCTEEQKPGTVAAVFAKGYKIDGSIIRYSMVQVTI